MDERRQYHRFLLHTEIDHEDVSSQTAKQSITKDISRGGICITTTGEPLEKGLHYKVKFVLPFSEEEIFTTARVMWIKQEGNFYDNGLAFVTIEDRYLNRIEEF